MEIGYYNSLWDQIWAKCGYFEFLSNWRIIIIFFMYLNLFLTLDFASFQNSDWTVYKLLASNTMQAFNEFGNKNKSNFKISFSSYVSILYIPKLITYICHINLKLGPAPYTPWRHFKMGNFKEDQWGCKTVWKTQGFI